MIDLQNLIIERIKLTKQIPDAINIIIDKQITKTMQSQTQINRSVLKYIANIKNKQRQRIRSQGQLLEQIKGLRFFNNKIIQEVYNISRSIFYLFNPSLQTIVENQYTNIEKLRILYSMFFEKQHTKISSKQMMKILSNQIAQSTPFILIGWTCQWSRNLLFLKLQQVLNLQYIRHEQELKRINNIVIKNFSDNITKRNNQSNLVNAVSVSTSISKSCENNLILTNKQSVFGLFLDQLTQYYKGFPLDLDFNFIKSMRKVYYKGQLFQNQQNLEKAVQILIQSKNKYIKDSQEKYKSQCSQYLQKKPNSLSQNWCKKEIDKRIPENNSKINKFKKVSKKMQFFERVKSESKQQNYKPFEQNHDSFLLCPKANEISFESSSQISKKIKREKDRRCIQLPEIIKKSGGNNNSKIYIRNKPTSSFSAQVHKSLISNYERALIKSNHITPKNLQFKNSQVYNLNPIQKLLKNYSCEQNKNQDLGILIRRQSQQFRENRKLMLQLLRQKNRNFILDK